jgi:carbon monoxide dehydrogenase subunit G
MDRFSAVVEIDAPPDQVWAVMSDVDRWHEWTPTIIRVRRRGSGPLAVGQWALVRQPRLPPALWRVVSLDPGRGFSWVSSGPGFRVTGSHAVESAPAGTRVTLALEIEGIFGPLMARLTGKLTEQYVALEGASLKKRCEMQRDPTSQRNP